MKIFLSPANHYKPYAVPGRSEREQMDKLAPLLKAELEKYKGVEVYITKIHAATQQYDGRPEEARGIGADLYFAMHTNASGSSATGGTATGACGFYHPAYPASKAIAEAVVRELNAICPIRSNRAAQPAIYPWNQGSCNFGELRVPARYGMLPVLIEHEFHDRLDCAKWICGNLPAIAAADARGIAKALGLQPKRLKGDVNGDGEVDNLDAALILQHDAGIADLTPEQKAAADYNGDGEVDNLDAAQILRHDAGL